MRSYPSLTGTLLLRRLHTTPEERNIISSNTGNGLAIREGSDGNIIQGNYIGTDVSGTLDRGNLEAGVRIRLGSTNNLIGGTEAGAGNVIAFNGAILGGPRSWRRRRSVD